MRELDLEIKNKTGLHARPAKEFVTLAKSFASDIQIQHGEKKVNAKSMISVLTLGVHSGGTVHIEIDGADEEEAALAIKEAVLSGLGEEDHLPEDEELVLDTIQLGDDLDATGIKGVAAAPGIAIGPILQLVTEEIIVDEIFTDPDSENERLKAATVAAAKELANLREEMEGVALEEAAIFDVHIELLEDPELLDDVSKRIAQQNESAGVAWQQSIVIRIDRMKNVEDALLAERALDIQDVGNRVLRILLGQDDSFVQTWPDHPVIVFAEDLTPSDTASFNKDRVLGICIAAGGPTSHSAILARALGIPAVVSAGRDILKIENGTSCILDGSTGSVLLDPDESQIKQAQSTRSEERDKQAAAEKVADDPAITQDGHRVEVAANVGNVSDAETAYAMGAEGVGLLRTEFLFLERSSAPSEEEQFSVYRDIAQALHGQPIIIRTLDIGGDKPLPYIDVPHEDNPFLGERGIRLCLARPELFQTQLRAIVRASEFGTIRIMFPMVSDLSELRAVRKLVTNIIEEMQASNIELGIMIEVPSAALMADAFAPEVDFFSIGTNDLTQYTLAMDRLHPALANQADGLHPAVLRLIEKTVEAAHAHGKWVGVCGSLGGEPDAVPILVGLGVDELSVAAPNVATVKAQVRTLNHAECQNLAKEVLMKATAAEVRASLH